MVYGLAYISLTRRNVSILLTALEYRYFLVSRLPGTTSRVWWMQVTSSFLEPTKKPGKNSSTPPPLGSPHLSSFYLWTILTSGMNKRKSNKKQVSLSQSLFRSKAVQNESSNNTTISNIIKGENYSTFANCSQNDQHREDSSSSKGPCSDECDDSFDLFLPRKNKPKASTSSSQPSYFEVKNRSRYFDESGELRVPKVIKDDDLELALAVSLQESKGTSVLLKPPKVEGTSMSLKPPKTVSVQPRGKLKQACSNSLLMRRTPEERERIITEKVAIVLMDNGKNDTSSVSCSRFNESFSLYSAHLRRQYYEMKTLWAMAQTDLSQVKLENFFIDVIIHFLPSNSMDDVDCFNPADASNKDGIRDEPQNQDLQHANSSEDLFSESGGEDSYNTQSPKRLRPSESLEALDKPKVKVSPNRSVNQSGEEQMSLKVDSLDILSLEVEESDSSCNFKNCEGMDDISVCTKSHRIHHNPHESPNLPHQNRMEKENVKKPLDFLKHYQKLAEDMLCVSKSQVSRVIEISSGSKTFYVHHCIFRARCPALLENLEINPECLQDYSTEVCEALFGYIYAADIGKCLQMNLEQKIDLMKCAKQFNIVCLVEELETEGVDGSKRVVNYQPNVSFPYPDCVPDHVESYNKVQSTPKDIRFTKPHIVKSEVESNQVVVLDSDSCSMEEVVNESPVGDHAVTEDEDLDNYLKDGMRLSEKTNSDSKSQGNIETPVVHKVTPLKYVNESEKSFDQYFQESFPSLAHIGVAFTPPPSIASKSNDTSEPTLDSSKPSGIIDCVTPGGQLVVSDKATPLPDYDTMMTPELQAALHKYGIRRGIGRRKAATLLKYIYDQIHPPADHPAVAKALGDIKNPAQLNSASAESDENDVYSLSSESSGDMQMFEDLGDVACSQPNTTECDRSRCLHLLYQLTPTLEKTWKKNGVGENIYQKRGKLGEFHHLLMNDLRSLLRAVGDYIKSNTLLYAAVLSYEPIWLNKFHKTVKNSVMKCNKKELMDVLDELGITFRTEQTERQMQRKGSKRKTKRKR